MSSLRNGVPLTFRPTGVTDAVDSTNSPPGSMAALVNLIPDVTTTYAWVSRPASTLQFNFSGMADPGFVSGLLVVGDRAYGMISTTRNPGFDEPFCLDLESGTASALMVDGITPNNVPASPPSTGAWTPPILAQVAGRVIVCHPGFPGDLIKFGWFDISGFTDDTEAFLTVGDATLTGNPTILGVQPGMTMTGTGIGAGSTVVGTAEVITIASGTILAGGTDILSSVINSTKGLIDVAIGQIAQGAFLPAGTTVVAINTPNDGDIQISNTITLSVDTSGLVFTFTGTAIELNQPAIGAGTQTITIAGGTRDQPLWGAGDCDRNPLLSIPLGVAQFNGRAYFADGEDGIPFSDSGFPCRRTNATQALLTSDGLAVTAIAPLMLAAPLTGGIVKALIAFEGPTKMQQIMGDAATLNLQMDALPVATGTLAPLSIAPYQFGTVFISPQGMRVIRPNGIVSEPMGDGGTGILAPFVAALDPSRIVLAAGADTIRISTRSGYAPGMVAQEFWYTISRQTWSGPHTFPASLIQPWRNTFLLTPLGIPARLFQSDAYQTLFSTYVENGTQLTWAWRTSLLPDNSDMAMHELLDTTLAVRLVGGTTAVVTALDENGVNGPASGDLDMWETAPLGAAMPAGMIDQTLLGPYGSGSIWGSAIWGQSLWGGSGTLFQQRSLRWSRVVVFKQMMLVIQGQSGGSMKIENLYMRYQILNYRLQDMVA